MESKVLIGLNTKWYRHKMKMTQEQFAKITNFKMAYISSIENGHSNLTCDTIDFIASIFKIKPEMLFNDTTARKAISLPKRIDMK